MTIQNNANVQYTDKLIHALSHANEQVRMGSIISLGKRKEAHTIMALVDCCFLFPTQITQNLQVVDSLAIFPNGNEKLTGLQKLCNHPCKPLQKRAKDALTQSNLS